CFWVTHRFSLRVRGHSSRFVDVCIGWSSFAFLNEIKHCRALISGSCFTAVSAACGLDGAESGFVDGWAIGPHARLCGDPFVDTGGDLVGFVCWQWFAELGVEFVNVPADRVIESVAVSEVMAYFAVCPGACCFKDRAVAT